MLFSINELGDLDIDIENESMCNQIPGDEVLSDFKTAKTIVLTYFKHNGNLRNKFYKYKRNTLTDEQIKSFFKEEISLAFQYRPDLIQFVKYEYLNDKASFYVLFYFQSKSLNKIMLDYDLDV